MDQCLPATLNDNEQVVLVVKGRTLPSLTDAIFVFLIAPAWIFLPLLILHRSFRPVSYVIATQRLLVIEAGGQLNAIKLDAIVKMKGTRSSLMVYGAECRLWLPRLPDAWFF